MDRPLLVAIVGLLTCSCDSVGNWFAAQSDHPETVSRSDTLPVSRHMGTVAKPDSSTPLSLAVGQWTRYQIRFPDGKTTSVLRQVVSREANGFWLELINGTPDAGTVSQLLVSPSSPGDSALPHVIAARIRMPNGIIKQIDGPAMQATRGGYQNLLFDVRLSSPWTGDLTKVSTPAGEFLGCVSSTIAGQFAGIETVTSATFHAGVPIGGLVSAQREDGTVAIQLTGFGTEGAFAVLERRALKR